MMLEQEILDFIHHYYSYNFLLELEVFISLFMFIYTIYQRVYNPLFKTSSFLNISKIRSMVNQFGIYLQAMSSLLLFVDSSQMILSNTANSFPIIHIYFIFFMIGTFLTKYNSNVIMFESNKD